MLLISLARVWGAEVYLIGIDGGHRAHQFATDVWGAPDTDPVL